jgi:hypothetical protein
VVLLLNKVRVRGVRIVSVGLVRINFISYLTTAMILLHDWKSDSSRGVKFTLKKKEKIETKRILFSQKKSYMYFSFIFFYFLMLFNFYFE